MTVLFGIQIVAGFCWFILWLPGVSGKKLCLIQVICSRLTCKLCFVLLCWSSKQTFPFFFLNFGNQLQKHMKCLKLQMKLCLVLKILKHWERTWGFKRCLRVWKQLQKFVNWWSENIEWPWNRWGINCTTNKRQLVGFVLKLYMGIVLQSYGWAKGVQTNNLWRFHPDLSDLSKLSELHH